MMTQLDDVSDVPFQVTWPFATTLEGFCDPQVGKEIRGNSGRGIPGPGKLLQNPALGPRVREK